MAADAREVVAAYGATWNEPDPARRLHLLESSWADDGTYVDPTAEVTGREALVAHIGGFRQTFPGATIETTSDVEEHHGWVRFAWALVDASGTPVMDGFDVGQLAGDGRLQRIVGFFGPFPPAPD